MTPPSQLSTVQLSFLGRMARTAEAAGDLEQKKLTVCEVCPSLTRFVAPAVAFWQGHPGRCDQEALDEANAVGGQAVAYPPELYFGFCPVFRKTMILLLGSAI